MEIMKKPHVVCIPAPAQGHINPIFNLAKLLHSKGIHITFVHTEFNFNRLTKSLQGTDSSMLNDLIDFRFETIPDGLPPDNKRGRRDNPALCDSLPRVGKPALRSLLLRLLASSEVPPITCMISDAHMHFPWEIGQELSIQVLLFYCQSACAVLSYLHLEELVKRGLFPLKDESYLTNGFLDTPVDWVVGLIKEAKLKHFPRFVRSTNPDETMFAYNLQSARYAEKAGNIILNTFDDLECQAIEGIKTKIPNVRTIGPLQLLYQQTNVHNFGSNLWKEDTNCLEWLDKWAAKSVIYVNYGSLTTLTPKQLEEFAWGLANSNHPFLWVIRDDLINGETSIMKEEYMEEIKGRGLVSSWCPQEKVLKHPSVAVFLTHCGWNSMLESISEGVPMICWPCFGDQLTNCLYACKKWGIGMELEEGDVDRRKVEEVVRQMMEGEKGKEMKENAVRWKIKAEKAIRPGGTSRSNLDNLVAYLLEKKHSTT